MVAHVDGSFIRISNDGTTALSAGDLALTTATAFVAGGDDLSTQVADYSLTPDTTINVSAPPAVDAAVRLKFTTGVTDGTNTSVDSTYEADDFFVGLVDHNTGVVTYATATNVENDPNEGGDLIIEAPGIVDNVVSVAYDMAYGTATDNAISVGGTSTETANSSFS